MLETQETPVVDPELHWVQHVYRRGVKQLTTRAVLAGMIIGAIMCLSNLYVFFKTGWSMGVTVTAVILAFAFFHLLRAVRVTKSEFTILENNAMGSVASAAAYMTGGGNMAAFGALLMLTSVRPDAVVMILWFSVIAAMGVFVAIPVKRQLINREQLAFPTGLATGETLKSLHQAGQGYGLIKAKLLAISGAAAAFLAWFRDAKADWMPFNIPAAIPVPFQIAGRAAKDWTLSLKSELILIGAGALMSFRAGWSLLIGGLLTYGVLGPSLFERGLIPEVSYKAIVNWTLWPGAALLVAAGFTTFAMDYKSIARSFAGIKRILMRQKQDENDPVAAVESPDWWFPAGYFTLAPLAVLLMIWLFQIPWWAAIIAIPLAVIMGFVAARVTGETDVTPTKALGPVTQLIYGLLTPGNLVGNIMSGNVTGGVGLHSADLLTDLKSGYMVGADPRQQLKAQLFGVIAGGLVVVPAFWLIIPDPALLGTEEWPAPSCLVWAGVSQAFSNGISTLHPSARIAALIGGILGIVLALLEKFTPARLKKFVPSSSGLGISMVIPGSNSIAMFIGASIAELLNKKKPALGDLTVFPVASGMIAGESLMGIVIAMLIVSGVLSR
ncbi:OPT/YSL family transporter [bacterium]|nr:OPT/YSL family transporter [bacterium]MCI0604950.1 OPT/YSL family transporter [bacterium]